MWDNIKTVKMLLLFDHHYPRRLNMKEYFMLLNVYSLFVLSDCLSCQVGGYAYLSSQTTLNKTGQLTLKSCPSDGRIYNCHRVDVIGYVKHLKGKKVSENYAIYAGYCGFH